MQQSSSRTPSRAQPVRPGRVPRRAGVQGRHGPHPWSLPAQDALEQGHLLLAERTLGGSPEPESVPRGGGQGQQGLAAQKSQLCLLCPAGHTGAALKAERLVDSQSRCPGPDRQSHEGPWMAAVALQPRDNAERGQPCLHGGLTLARGDDLAGAKEEPAPSERGPCCLECVYAHVPACACVYRPPLGRAVSGTRAAVVFRSPQTLCQ
ncbi:uncharacterized protein [Physeter macrocephalus]|uniref:Uncharacterized protein isoform X2 n=1 Tax=Physeter macrocephalus TaxID=9755 RepID=A0A9W2X6D3_PHYMC|nr:uncharacterized protein LOC114484783 isoform X2 [Physeter catodon]